jgi:hypothetical protein
MGRRAKPSQRSSSPRRDSPTENRTSASIERLPSTCVNARSHQAARCARMGCPTSTCSRALQPTPPHSAKPSAFPLGVWPLPPPWSLFTRRLTCCRSLETSTTLLFDRQTSSNGAFRRQDRHDRAGIRAITAAPRCQSSGRRSTSPVVRQAGHCACRNVVAAHRRKQHGHPPGLALEVLSIPLDRFRRMVKCCGGPPSAGAATARLTALGCRTYFKSKRLDSCRTLAKK